MPFDFKAVNLACDVNGYVNAYLEKCGLGRVYSGWYGFCGIKTFRKIPNGLRDVVSGKWGGRECEEYQGLVKRGRCPGNVMCVGRAYVGVILPFHGQLDQQIDQVIVRVRSSFPLGRLSAVIPCPGTNLSH